MLDLVFLLLSALWAAGIGRRVLRWLGALPDHPADVCALAIPLGLGLLALAALGLAELGWLTRGALGAVWILGAVGASRDLGTILAGAARLLTSTRPARGTLDIPRLVDAALAATLVGTLLTALAPVTDGDALCYHLQVPKVFLLRHGAVFDPDLHETVYPLVTEMLYAVGLAARGPVACRLIQWLLGVTFALNVTALARPVLGARARWAGTVALLVPAISNGMGAPLNDVALAAFGNGAIVAWTRWHDRPSLSGAVLVGLLAGIAVGVKYPALVLTGLLGAIMTAAVALRWWRGDDLSRGSQPRPRLTHLLGFAAAVVLTGGWWYARAYWFTGNPVFPFFRETFGGAGLVEVLDPVKRPMPVTPWRLLTALVPMTLHPARFDSVSHQFGPAFLLFLPLLVVLKPTRQLVAVAGLGYAFLTVCLTQRQSMRFVLIAVGPLSVAVAWVASRCHDRTGVVWRLVTYAFLTMLALEASWSLYRARHGLPVVAGFESADHYLHRREPTYRVARWVGRHLPATARLIGQDHRGFYFPRDYTMELAHRRRTGLGRRGEPAAAIVARLRAEGFTHLLLCPPDPEDAVEFDPTLGRRLAPWLNGRRPIYREAINDPDGVVRRYALFELEPAPLAGRDRGVLR